MSIFDNKRSFIVMVKAIQASKKSVSLNQTWQQLHQELGIGDVFNQTLRLTASDRNNLSRIILAETKVDPATIDLTVFKSATRTQVAHFAINEKWAGRKIKEDIIYIRSLTNSVKLTRDYSLPQNSYLAVTWQEACKHQHKLFVVIENLETFLIAEQINWPESIRQRNPLIMYRGDKEVTPAAIKNFIKNSKLSYVVFFDYDPAGLMMALTLPRPPSLIIPALSSHQLKTHTKELAFNRQVIAREYLAKMDSTHHYYQQANHIIENKIAVTQERLVSKNIPLNML